MVSAVRNGVLYAGRTYVAEIIVQHPIDAEVVEFLVGHGAAAGKPRHGGRGTFKGRRGRGKRKKVRNENVRA